MARNKDKEQEIKKDTEDKAEINNSTVETQEEKHQRPKKVEIDRNEMVLCKNVTHGKLVYVSKKTGAEYIWDSYGAEEYLEVGELLTMKASMPRILTEPWMIIEDEEVAKYLALDKIYSNIIPIDKLDEFFTWSVENMEEAIKKAPNGTKQLIAQKAKEIVKSGELTINKLRLLERILNIVLEV